MRTYPRRVIAALEGKYRQSSGVAQLKIKHNGVLGYFMRLYGFSLGPVILGVILSRLLDDNWRRAIISDQESLPRLLHGIVTSPLSLTLFLAVIVIFLSKTPLWSMLMRKKTS